MWGSPLRNSIEVGKKPVHTGIKHLLIAKEGGPHRLECALINRVTGLLRRQAHDLMVLWVKKRTVQTVGERSAVHTQHCTSLPTELRWGFGKGDDRGLPAWLSEPSPFSSLYSVSPHSNLIFCLASIIVWSWFLVSNPGKLRTGWPR